MNAFKIVEVEENRKEIQFIIKLHPLNFSREFASDWLSTFTYLQSCYIYFLLN